MKLETRFYLLVVLCCCVFGCGEPSLLQQVKDRNKTNVMKVKTCFEMFASRNGQRSPQDEEELLEFLSSGKVDKNLERIDVDPGAIQDIFVSQRDGQPLKIKWGIRMNPDNPKPIAFEAVGVDGVRLVAADVLLEVDTEEEYEKLWEGEYVAESIRRMKQAKQEIE